MDLLRSSDVLISAQELLEMTMHYVRKPEKTPEEKCASWMHWFDKRYEKIFKDAAARCEFLVSLPAPYQPAGKEDQGPLREIRNTLRRRLPGCEVYYTEEECDGKILYFIEISWAGAQH